MLNPQATDNDMLDPGENKLWGQGVVAYTTNSTNHPECRFPGWLQRDNTPSFRLFGLSELIFIDELRQEQVRLSPSSLTIPYRGGELSEESFLNWSKAINPQSRKPKT